MINNVLLYNGNLESFLMNWIILRNESKINFSKLFFDLDLKKSQNQINFLLNVYDPFYFIIDESLVLNDIENKLYKYLLMLNMTSARYNSKNIYLPMSKNKVNNCNTDLFKNNFYKMIENIDNKKIHIINSFQTEELPSIIKYYIENCTQNEKLDLITKTYQCDSDVLIKKYRDIYKLNDNNVYEKKHNIEVYGCMNCDNCLEKIIALTYANYFMVFENGKLFYDKLKDVLENNLINKQEHRAKAILKLTNFNTFYTYKDIKY